MMTCDEMKAKIKQNAVMAVIENFENRMMAIGIFDRCMPKFAITDQLKMPITEEIMPMAAEEARKAGWDATVMPIGANDYSLSPEELILRIAEKEAMPERELVVK